MRVPNAVWGILCVASLFQTVYGQGKEESERIRIEWYISRIYSKMLWSGCVFDIESYIYTEAHGLKNKLSEDEVSLYVYDLYCW